MIRRWPPPFPAPTRQRSRSTAGVLILQLHLGEVIVASPVVGEAGLILALSPPGGPGPDVVGVVCAGWMTLESVRRITSSQPPSRRTRKNPALLCFARAAACPAGSHARISNRSGLIPVTLGVVRSLLARLITALPRRAGVWAWSR